ncbi:unnamed protein product [Rhodiola kirilowii]
MLFAKALHSYTANIKPQTLPEPKIPLQKSAGRGFVFPHYARNSQLRNFVSKINNYRSGGICLGGQSRFYYVHRHHVERSKPMWFQNHRNALLCSGAFAALYLWNLETVPYTNRKDSMLLSRMFDYWLGELLFRYGAKEMYQGKILPENHQTSIRVKLIANNVIEAALQKGKEKARRHLCRLNWEVIVVKEPEVNAYCIPGGKIVIFTGLLNHFKTDAEIAAIIGHEVAHVVARHSTEKATRLLWFAFLRLILKIFFTPALTNAILDHFLELPISRRMEMEADYIGLLLMASAGYDPCVGPKVYEKFGQIIPKCELEDKLSTHPSSKKRAQALAQPNIMEEALSIYRQVRPLIRISSKKFSL